MLRHEQEDSTREASAPAGEREPEGAHGAAPAGTGSEAPEATAPQKGAGDEAPSSVEDGAAEAARLRERVAALEAREQELKEQYVRLLAEFDNYRRRTRQEMEAMRATAAERLLSDVLPVLDSLEHAIAASGESADTPLGQGVRLIRQQLGDVLARHGLMPIEAVGQPFDPATMEAVAEAEPGEGAPPGHVVEEYRRGYRLHGKVLRPSLVKVAAG